MIPGLACEPLAVLKVDRRCFWHRARFQRPVMQIGRSHRSDDEGDRGGPDPLGATNSRARNSAMKTAQIPRSIASKVERAPAGRSAYTRAA